MREGRYVMVTSVPEPWEGSGENTEDRESFVGHIGLVVEVDYRLKQSLVRFPHPTALLSSQRNIEHDALTIVGNPKGPISDHLWEQI